MSEPSIYEAQEMFFEDYEAWCAENKVPATFDGFSIWLEDSDLDNGPDWADVETV